MEKHIIDLYDYFGVTRPVGAQGYLTAYIIDDYDYCSGRVRPAMLVLGGGGYRYVSSREQEPIAFEYTAKGFQTFILEYSVAPLGYPTQLIEACMAMAYIRENAEKFYVDTEHVCSIGFSAGGHLCGMLATLHDRHEVNAVFNSRKVNCRPDAVILCYAVLSAYNKTHEGSVNNITLGNEQLKKIVDIPAMVNENTPPAFIWATSNDNSVPVESSLLMALSYRKYDIPVELHVYENGTHGLSLGTKEVCTVNQSVQSWVDLSHKWLISKGFVVKEKGE